MSDVETHYWFIYVRVLKHRICTDVCHSFCVFWDEYIRHGYALVKTINLQKT